MAGVSIPSVVGAHYLLLKEDLDEPLVTMKEGGEGFHICHRRTQAETKKKVIAIVKDEELARKLVLILQTPVYIYIDGRATRFNIGCQTFTVYESHGDCPCENQTRFFKGMLEKAFATLGVQNAGEPKHVKEGKRAYAKARRAASSHKSKQLSNKGKNSRRITRR